MEKTWRWFGPYDPVTLEMLEEAFRKLEAWNLQYDQKMIP